MMPGGNAEQIRAIADVMAKATVAEFTRQSGKHEEPISPNLKWWGGIAAAFLTFILTGLAGWIIVSVDAMQDTLPRMDERLKAASTAEETRFNDMERRVRSLESYHAQGGE